MRYLDDVAVGEKFRSPRPYVLVATEMDEFAERWDPQPYHLDASEAAQVADAIFASALLTLSIAQKLLHDSGFFGIAMIAGLGIDEMRMPNPALAGDELSVLTTITAMRASRHRPDRGVITNHVRLANQHEEPVLTYSLTSLARRRHPSPPAR